VGRQALHRFVAAVAAVLGVLAVALAVAQLGGMLGARLRDSTETGGLQGLSAALLRLLSGHWPMAIEVIAILLALGAVIFGGWAQLHQSWLTERSKAERLRSLKFRFLADPDLWSGLPGARERAERKLAIALGQISALTFRQVREWSRRDEPPLPPHVPADGTYALGDLVRFYRAERLDSQIAYLERECRRRSRWERLTAPISPALFYLCAVVVMWHFLLESRHRLDPADLPGPLSIALVLLAGTLPAIAAGVRTLRISREYGRNTFRFEAKAAALETLRNMLTPDAGPAQVFLVLWSAEQVLESDHREWLRLMIEAEWF
jgi:hypothetical protein